MFTLLCLPLAIEFFTLQYAVPSPRSSSGVLYSYANKPRGESFTRNGAHLQGVGMETAIALKYPLFMIGPCTCGTGPGDSSTWRGVRRRSL
jgi:hypothetical protein